jgi:hypothetical protein
MLPFSRTQNLERTQLERALEFHSLPKAAGTSLEMSGTVEATKVFEGYGGRC